MRELGAIGVLVAMLLALVGGVWWIMSAESAERAPVGTGATGAAGAGADVSMERERGRGRVSDVLHIAETAEDFFAGEADRVTVQTSNGPPRLELADGRPDQFPRSGTWTSPVHEPGIDFLELLPSWNVRTPPDTGIRVDGRVRIDGQWSPWLDFGYWGRVPPPAAPEAFDYGEVAVDILELTRPADAWQLRVSFYSYLLDAAGEPPTLLRLAAVASGVTDEPAAQGIVSWAGDHAVPFIAQRSAGERIGGDVCSPTCVSMVAGFHGADRPLAENALAIYDAEHGIFGNWNRAVARAGELGLRGQLERFTSLEQARARLRDGLPLIASIRYKAGEAPSFVMEKTGGHLIVLRGVTPEGDFIVNDPVGAAASEATDDKPLGEAAVYKAAELRKAWLESSSGVGYVLMPPADAATRPSGL